MKLYFDTKNGTIITETQLRDKFEQIQRETPDELDGSDFLDFEDDCYIYNGGTLIDYDEDETVDFYAVQIYCDGFGNNTVTLAVFETKTEAVEYRDEIEKEHLKRWHEEISVIVAPQTWGNYISYFN